MKTGIVFLLSLVFLASVRSGTPVNFDPNTVLNPQNEERSSHGLTPLSWDDDLAKVAQNHTDSCVPINSTTATEASQMWFQLRNIPYTGGYSQSLGINNLTAANATVAPWIAEKTQWTCTAQSCNGFCEYNQIVWLNSTLIGCGISLCNDTSGAYQYLICFYNPSGNVNGQLPYPCDSHPAPAPQPQSVIVPQPRGVIAPQPHTAIVPQSSAAPEPVTNGPQPQAPLSPQIAPEPQSVVPVTPTTPTPTPTPTPMEPTPTPTPTPREPTPTPTPTPVTPTTPTPTPTPTPMQPTPTPTPTPIDPTPTPTPDIQPEFVTTGSPPDDLGINSKVAGIPMWAWIVIGIVLLVVIIIIIVVVVVRSRRKNVWDQFY